MRMSIPGEQPTRTLETAPEARIVRGVKVYGKGTSVRALDATSADFAVGKFTAIM